MRNYTRVILCCMLFALAVADGVSADGFLLPIKQPDVNVFSVKYHHVDVYIDDQAATTKVDQVFHNDTKIDEEGTYIFPLPKNASISKFSMFIGEKEAQGKILDRDEARDLYESVVRSRKDPALLEYIDRNTFQARVYPIPANGDKRIRLEYNEILRNNNTLCKYVYPLSTERLSAKPLQDVRITIRIKSSTSINNIYSPTHAIRVEQTKPGEATVSWTAKNVKPDEDLVLYFSQAKKDVALDVLTYRENGKQGYFMLLASPQVADEQKAVRPKNVVFVLDRTGSMAGEKIVQAKGALKYCLKSLKAYDEFNVITFNESPDVMWEKSAEDLVPATKTNVDKALAYIDRIDASGGTNLNAAVVRALKAYKNSWAKSSTTPDFIVLITDGVPTVGEENIENILKNAKAEKSDARIFTFGVGYDVNTHLLDLLTEQTGGKPEYVLPNEDIEASVSTFFTAVSEPLLTNISIKATGVKILDMFPSNPMPDLFKGSQLIVLGKYDGQGTATITLSGNTSNGVREWSTTVNLPASDTERDFIPQIWAARKLGFLLDQVRLHRSDELIKEIILLSKEWGIPTEFTSFLVEEPVTAQSIDSVVAGTQVRLEEARKAESGKWSVAQSVNNNALKDRAQVQASPGAAPMSPDGLRAGNVRGYMDSEGNIVTNDRIQNIGSRTFYLRGSQWTDAQVDGKGMKSVQIKQFSNAHFKLLKAVPDLVRYQRLGNMTILVNNQSVEIGASGKEDLSDAELNTILGV
ncbi:MAG: VIT and VWA domain-containing protein [Armatimonadota bacterium]|nr:VIT and VWA domain-containing protein [bacterium]